MMPLKIRFLAGLLFCTLALSAQVFPEHPEAEQPRNKGKALLLHFTVGADQPGGDLADRFGRSGGAGLGAEWLFANNVIAGLEGQFFFGNPVHDDPLAILRTPEGDIIGNDQLIASVVLRQRGWYGGALVGKLIPLNKSRSGLRVTFGAGLTRHKIRVQDDQRTLTQITGEYAKGYDRLTGGVALQQFIGWQTLSKNRRINFLIGFQFNEGFTHSLRDWDFTEKRKLDGQRLDLRFGIRAAWTLPFYLGGAREIYY